MTRPFARFGALFLVVASGCTGPADGDGSETVFGALTYESTACKVVYTITNQWGGGFGADVQVTNKLGSSLNGWKLEWDWPSGQTVTQIWNATSTQSGAHVAAVNVSYNGTVSAGGTVGFGFNGAFGSTNTAPTSFTLNGVSCSGTVTGSGGTVTGSGGAVAGSGGKLGSGGSQSGAGGSTGAVCGTANENGSVSLSCPSGQVVKSIAFASYGTPSGTCGAFTTGGCNASNSASVVSNACVGKASCTVGANNTTFGDPCSGTGKRLYVQATCGTGTTGSGGSSNGSGGAPGAGGSTGKVFPPKFAGNITTNGQVRSDFKQYWNQITPENEGKWGSVQPSQGTWNWGPLDAIYKYANDNNLIFKEHCFVWGAQQPSWVNNSNAQTAVRTWMQNFCQRYPNTKLIDVVNEPPPHTTPAYINGMGGTGVTGYDWIVNAFKWAREFCPNAILILNDYNTIEYGGDNTNIINIANKIKAAGAPIDAIGCQAHAAYGINTSTVKSYLDKIATQTGLPIYITEYDINLADDTQQKTVMADQFNMFWTDSNVKGVTLWGYIVGSTWLSNSGLMTSAGAKRPAMSWLMSYLGR